MFENRKINGGLPLIALSFENYKDKSSFKFESNYKREKTNWNDLHKTHAEWNLINKNNFDKENTKNLSLIITTTPCDSCANLIIEKTQFKEVFYLTEKFKDDSQVWKQIPNIKKFEPRGPVDADLVKRMIRHWDMANLQNKKKTLNRRK